MTGKSLRFIGWCGILNLPLALYYSTYFAPEQNHSSLFVLITFSSAAVGLFFLYYFLGSLLLIFPIAAFKKSRGPIFLLYCALIIALLHIILAVDAHVFAIYRFHVNLAMLDLFVNSGGQIISFSTGTVLSIVFESALLVIYSLLSVALSFYLTEKKTRVRFWVIGALALYTGANLAHAYSSAKAILPVTEIANRLPMYEPLTMNTLLIRLGITSKEELANRKVSMPHAGYFTYPKHKLEYAPVDRKLNVLFLVIDTLRGDMLTPAIMPNTYAYGKNAYVFHNHYSSSNSTRGGIFGLFYGLPPSYWHVALSSGIPSAVIQAVRDKSYALGVFTSATVYRPEFHSTVFVGEKNLRIQSTGRTAIERDANAIGDFASFADRSLKDKRNFFGFVFLDNVHGPSVPEGYQGPFHPSWTNVNHLELNNDTDTVPYFNLYKNSVHFADTNIKRVLDILEKRGLDKNTVVIITSDHGENFNEHHNNFWGHNSNFTDAQIKIPLVIKWPGRGRGETHLTSTAYDVTATILPEVFGVTNPVSDFSIGQNLFDLKPIDYFLCGSYLENAIVERDRIVLINKIGMLRFKDKRYNDSEDTKRDPHLLEAIKTFSEYLEDK